MPKILVADDRPDALFVIKTTFESAGHQVVETEDPRAVVPLARKSSPDAIVLDVMMPDVSGYEVLDALRQQPAMRKVPILMLSALSSAENKIRGLRLGADDYVTKPYAPEELVARVESLIARQVQEGGLQGSLAEHPFSEVVQSLEQNRKTGELEITTPRHTAWVVLRGGKVASAELSRLQGAEAVLAMLELDEGKFAFRAAEGGETDDGESDGLITLHPLLLEASWIEDELRAREAHLPALHQELELPAEIHEVPGELSGLPIRETAERLEIFGGITLGNLLEEEYAAPNKIRLSVAWLHEQGIAVPRLGDTEAAAEDDSEATRAVAAQQPGAVSVPPAQAQEPGGPAASVVVSEDLDSAIRELFQEALFRGFSLADVRLSILVDDAVWDSLAPLLLAIPDSLLGREGRRSKRRAFLDRRGHLVLAHETGALTLHLETVRPAAQPLVPPADCAGVILWLGGSFPHSVLQPLIAETQRGSAQGTGFLFISTVEATRRKMTNTLRRSSRWKVLPGVPEILEDLLVALCQTDPT